MVFYTLQNISAALHQKDMAAAICFGVNVHFYTTRDQSSYTGDKC